MAVTKRTRYEVLRRDNYTCRYCGASAPDVVLQVDHVIHQALGGADDPSNLVAACRDCNAGKSSATPDQELVAQVNAQAVAMSKALRDNLAERGREVAENQSWCDNVAEWWNGRCDELDLRYAWMEDDWRPTMVKWRAMGVPANIITNAIDTALANERVPQGRRYRYMCGIVWTTIREATDDAAPKARVGTPKKCGHCTYCQHPEWFEEGSEDAYCTVYGPANPDPDEEPYSCPVCHRQDCMYQLGIDDGMDYQMRHDYEVTRAAMDHYKTCPEVNHG